MKRHDTLAFRPDPPNRRSFVLGLLCCLSLLFLLPGCSTSGSSTGSGPLTGMVLRNPMQQVYEGLVRWDDKNQIVPNIAEKWEVSQDGKTYTFHLKHGVKFHHGREVKAADFKYSIERACDPTLNSPNIGYLRDIVGV